LGCITPKIHSPQFHVDEIMAACTGAKEIARMEKLCVHIDGKLARGNSIYG